MKFRPVVTILATLLTVSAAAGVCPLGDLDGNCRVDIYDLKIFAQQWLDASGSCSGPGCADFDGVNRVNMADFSVLEDCWRMTGSALVINEFMASNSSASGIHDPQGDYDDWIEIYNATNGPIDIAGMYVTDNLDNPTKWQIPSGYAAQTTIPAHGYLILWADGETGDGPLHLSFNLDKDGEDVGLFLDANTTMDGIAFSTQITNYSYGRYPDGNDQWYILSTPTPGSSNSGITAEMPGFSRTSGVFTTSFSLVLTAEPGAVIRYTTDRSTPTASSPIYSSPVSIGGTAQVRARAYRTGFLPSPVVGHTFIKLNADMQGFNSNLPIVIIETFGQEIYGWPNDKILHPVSAIFIDANDGGRATITDSPEFAGRAGMHVRGHSSRGWPKKSYKFETWDEDNNDLKVDLLGLPGDSDWVVHAPYCDKTMMRNVLAYKWFGDLGEYSVRTRYFELFMNENGGAITLGDLNSVDPCAPFNYNGDYRGVYALVETIKQGKDRVDIAEIGPGDNTEPNVTGGYIVKIEMPRGDPSDPIFSAGCSTWWSNVYPQPDRITSAQQSWLISYLNTVQSKMGSGAYADAIDPNAFFNYRCLVELAKNNEEQVFSTYWHKDRAGKMRWGPLWDYDITFGNINYGGCWNTVGFHSSRDWGCWGLVFDQREFEMGYADRWFDARKDILNTEKLMSDINDINALLTEAQVRNYRRWPVLGIYLWPNPDWGVDETPYNNPPTTYRGNVDWMKNWILNRLAWLDLNVGYAAPPPVINLNGVPNGGGYAQTGDIVSMSAPAGTIYYTTDGNDPRLPGGAVRPGALTYSAGSSTVTFVAEAVDKRVLVPTSDIGTTWRGANEPYNDSSWRNGTGGVGYDRNTSGVDYTPYINTNVEPNMYNKMGSCYIRIPFNADGNQLPQYTSLKLSVRYDDGFVAFINGSEVASANPASPLLWNSLASTTHDDSQAIILQEFDISSHLNDLHSGSNILAIHGLNQSTTSSDFLISAELTGTVPSQSGIVLAGTTRFKGRIKDGSSWSALNDAAFAVGPVAQQLRVNEIMYHHLDTNDPNDPNAEFIELTNIGPNTINLAWVQFTDGIDFTFPSVAIGPGQYTVVVKDRNVFEQVYGTGINIAGQFSGSLDNGGERITLKDAAGGVIHDFEYKDGWRENTDGEGFSLTIIDGNDPDVNSWGCKDAWRASAYIGGSPGEDDGGVVPNPGAIVINEILAHSHSGMPDWIEFYNTTGDAIDISGWFVSDSDTNLMKYEFRPGTTIGAYGYLVVYEDANFGTAANDPGRHAAFALSENGETVYLSSGDNSEITGYRDKEDFGASETGVTFACYRKSTGEHNFVAAGANTPGSENAYPKVGPVVIGEIMYHPQHVEPSNYDDDKYEYVELKNISGSAVTLYDSNEGESWKFTDGIDYTFPAGPNAVTIAAGGFVVVVKDRSAFSARYPGVSPTIIYGPYDGWLANDGEKVELSMPGDVDEFQVRHYICVERVDYSDGLHPDSCPETADPWPGAADGQGKSLGRRYLELYGNDPNNWSAANPTPGQ